MNKCPRMWLFLLKGYLRVPKSSNKLILSIYFSTIKHIFPLAKVVAKKCTQLLTPFSDTVFQVLSHGVICFVATVKPHSHWLELLNIESETSIFRFFKPTY